jgi:glucose/arabinose dehydrogenase
MCELQARIITFGNPIVKVLESYCILIKVKKILIIGAVIVIAVVVGWNKLKGVINTQTATQLFVEGPNKALVENLPQGGELNFALSVPSGFKLGLFADLGSSLPRVLEFDPAGVLFASIPAQGKIVALPDENKDGVADKIVDVLTGLNRPHGMAFGGGKIFIGESDKVVRYDYDPGSFGTSNRQMLFSLPSGGRHFTRTIKIYEDKLYTSVGSSCDTCIEEDSKRSTILVSGVDGSNLKVFAKGLRNTVFFVIDKEGRIWGNDMGRDFLGDNLPPDELNIIEDGGDYGWPFCYGDKVRDSKFMSGLNLDYCNQTKSPAFKYPAHIAPLGLAFIDSSLFEKSDQGDILSSFHGSWNSSTPVGYKIVKLKAEAGGVTGMEDFITGFIKGGEVLGRPVDLVFAENGTLFISDDKAGAIYILTK